MIEFLSLSEATQYISICPLCQGNLDFRDRDVYVSRKFGAYSYDRIRTTLTFNRSGLSYTDIIHICLETQEVTRDTSTTENVVGSPLMNRIGGSPPPTSGDEYLRLGMECANCHDYNFMIQIVVALEKLIITKIVLNSENISFRTKEGYYEIRNIYTTKETEYLFSIGGPGSEGTFTVNKHQTLPLIPLDRTNPNKTLQRIKNLLIFT